MSDTAENKQAELENTIQIALDSADAAMEVTTEFARISSEFAKAKVALEKAQKTSMITMISGVGVALITTLVIAFLFVASLGDLKNLTRSNVELLTILAENVRDLTNNTKVIEETAVQSEKLLEEFAGLRTSVSDVTTTVSNMREQIGDEHLPTALSSLGDRISSANGEFTQLTLRQIDERLTEQNALTLKVMDDMTVVLNSLAERSTKDKAALEDLSNSIKALRQRNQSLTREVAAARKRAEQAEREAAPAPAPGSAQPARDDNVIRFPRQ